MNHFEQMWDAVFIGWAMFGGLILICAEKEEKAKKS